jgi:hypothetical protein
MKSFPDDAPADAFKTAFEKEGQTDFVRRLRFTDQIPAVVVTAALVVGAIVWLQHDDAIRRAADLEPLRSEAEALRVQNDENRQQLEATNKLLRDAIARNDGEVFRSDEELQKLNGERIDLLADAIVKKVVPALPAPISAAEGAQMQAEQVDKVAARLSDNLKPMLSELSANQKAASAEVVRQYQGRVQQLNTDLAATQSAAQDALKLTHQVSALYLDSFRDQGVLVRLLSLPSDIVIDTAKLNLITSRDRAKVEKDLSAKMNELDQRLDSIKATTDATRG